MMPIKANNTTDDCITNNDNSDEYYDHENDDDDCDVVVVVVMSRMMVMLMMMNAQFKDRPLYLEWAPMAVFNKNAPDAKQTDSTEEVENNSDAQVSDVKKEEEEAPAPAQQPTIQVQ